MMFLAQTASPLSLLKAKGQRVCLHLEKISNSHPLSQFPKAKFGFGAILAYVLPGDLKPRYHLVGCLNNNVGQLLAASICQQTTGAVLQAHPEFRPRPRTQPAAEGKLESHSRFVRRWARKAGGVLRVLIEQPQPSAHGAGGGAAEEGPPP